MFKAVSIMPGMDADYFFFPDRLFDEDVFSFDSEKSKCLGLISGKNFDRRAVSICAKQDFTTQKLDCLKIIADRYFVIAESLNICSGMSFNSQQMECLKKADTKPFITAVAKAEKPDKSFNKTRKKIERALKQIQRKKYRRAEKTLEGVLKDLNAGKG